MEFYDSKDLEYWKKQAAEGRAVIIEIPPEVLLDLDINEIERRRENPLTTEELQAWISENREEMEKLAAAGSEKRALIRKLEHRLYGNPEAGDMEKEDTERGDSEKRKPEKEGSEKGYSVKGDIVRGYSIKGDFEKENPEKRDPEKEDREKEDYKMADAEDSTNIEDGEKGREKSAKTANAENKVARLLAEESFDEDQLAVIMEAILEDLPPQYLLTFMKKDYSPDTMKRLLACCRKMHEQEEMNAF